jgi:hypothetical protein
VGIKDFAHHIIKEEQPMSRKRTPDEPSPETTAVAEPAAQTQTFADRVGQKQRPSAPDPFGIAMDNEVGIRLFESKQDRQMAIKFQEKPSQAVIEKLKDAGYRWNPKHKIWVHPIGEDSAMRTRIDAERLYQEIRTMMREEKGLEASPEVPF